MRVLDARVQLDLGIFKRVNLQGYWVQARLKAKIPTIILGLATSMETDDPTRVWGPKITSTELDRLEASRRCKLYLSWLLLWASDSSAITSYNSIPSSVQRNRNMTSWADRRWRPRNLASSNANPPRRQPSRPMHLIRTSTTFKTETFWHCNS